MARTSNRGRRLLTSAQEALAIARGEISPARHTSSAPTEVDVRAIRERQGLTQSEFAAKYRFSVARIRDWEQGRSRPDAAMRAYLLNIAAIHTEASSNRPRNKGIRRVGISVHSIEAWSSSRKAQELLPVLVRRLISRFANITAIAMPGGDSISAPGWDGKVDAAGSTAWIPSGQSFWELGTSRRAEDKAELDYLKRVTSTPVDVRAASTFIFVSSRRWDGKNEWVNRKRSAREWMDVRAYDASDLEQWLEQSPAISIWFGEQLGMSGSGLRSVEEAWRAWSEQTDPPLTIGSLLEKRSEAYEKILRHAGGSQQTIPVRADSIEEAVAFVCACFLRDNANVLAARSLVVTSEEGWRFVDANDEIDIVIVSRPELARDRTPNDKAKIFIPLVASDRGSFYRGGAADEQPVTAERLRPRDFEDALVDLGIDQADAQRLARVTSRSWTVFRRLRARNDAIVRPAWLHHDATRVLTTLCLVGSWAGDRPGDRAVVASIAGRPYEDIERELRVLMSLDDAPAIAIGPVWRAKSPLELLHLVGERITRDELDRFFATAEVLLSSHDPALELSADTRWKAALYKKAREESGLVFDSICDALIKLAVLGPDVDNLAIQGIATRVASLVRALLDGADGERWLSLHRILSELAEAAPAEFMTGLEMSFRSDNPAVARLIQETGRSGLLGECWHADLLRALEILAWRPQDLMRVIGILIKLINFPVAGNWLNTPENTLLSIFRSWYPQTSATIETRIEILDRVIALNEAVGWNLLKRLALTTHDSAMQNARPRWRDDDAGAGYGATNSDIRQMIAASTSRLLVLSKGRAARLGSLVESFDLLDPKSRAEIMEAASEYANPGKSDADRAALRESIRSYVSWQKKYATTQSKRIPADLAALEQLREQLRPQDPLVRHMWLFEKDWIDLAEEKNETFEERRGRIDRLRLTAVQEIHAEGGVASLEEFIDRVRVPFAVGVALHSLFETAEDSAEWILCQKTRMEPDSQRARAVSGLISNSERWRPVLTEQLVTVVLEKGWSSREIANLLLTCPNDEITWLQISRVSEVTKADYWARVRPMLWNQSAQEINQLTCFLLDAGRPRAAFFAVHVFLEKVDSHLLFKMLDEIRLSEESDAGLPEQWYLANAFDQLEASGLFDVTALARLEFAYAQILQFSDRGLKSLNRSIATDPSLFVELLSHVYKAQHGEAKELTEHERNIATNAWTVLHNCRLIPGQRENGAIQVSELVTWVDAARRLGREADREEMTDYTIGELLSAAPAGDDGAQPVEEIRELLDREDADAMRRGFYFGTLNSRGVTTRGFDEGGSQERQLAKSFQQSAEFLSRSFPRLADTLVSIQRHYESMAQHEDHEAKLRIEGP